MRSRGSFYANANAPPEPTDQGPQHKPGDISCYLRLIFHTCLILSLQAFECVAKVKDFTANVLVIKHVSNQDDVSGAEHFTAKFTVAVQEVGLQHLHSLQALLAHLGVDVKSKPAVWINVICNNATCTTPLNITNDSGEVLRSFSFSPLSSNGDCTASTSKVKNFLLGNSCRLVKNESGEHLHISGKTALWKKKPVLPARKLPTRGHLLGLDPPPWLCIAGMRGLGGTAEAPVSCGSCLGYNNVNYNRRGMGGCRVGGFILPKKLNISFPGNRQFSFHPLSSDL